MKLLLIALPAIVGALTAGCIFPSLGDDELAHGSGVLGSEQRLVDPFEQVNVANGINVELAAGGVGDGSIVLTVRGDDNLLSLVETRVVGSTLLVDLADWASLDSHYPLEVSATVPVLVAASVIDGASLEANHLDAWSFVLDVDNGAAASLSGGVDILDVNADNGAMAWARHLDTERATIAVRSGAQLEVCATELVEGEVTGGGHAEIFCDPDDVDVDVNSGGTLVD